MEPQYGFSVCTVQELRGISRLLGSESKPLCRIKADYPDIGQYRYYHGLPPVSALTHVLLFCSQHPGLSPAPVSVHHCPLCCYQQWSDSNLSPEHMFLFLLYFLGRVPTWKIMLHIEWRSILTYVKYDLSARSPVSMLLIIFWSFGTFKNQIAKQRGRLQNYTLYIPYFLFVSVFIIFCVFHCFRYITLFSCYLLYF